MTECNQQAVHLIESLMNVERYPHKVDNLQLVETHISWVILTGPYAYKIKKPVDFGFLDFSTLDKRRYYCEEELRLNQRTAPSIYLEVLAVTGSVSQPQWAGDGEVIEYAVKMRQFAQEDQLDRILVSQGLTTKQIDAFAEMVADFHHQIEVSDSRHHYGEPGHILQPVRENFSQIREHIHQVNLLPRLEELEQWSLAQYQKLVPVLHQRKQQGHIRECHGDMHLRNLAWIDNRPVAFDCIEFNPELRWIDVISEIAFLIMDLQDRQQNILGQRFLNAYLQYTGDYGGVRLLPFYLVYRALVRAKVDAIRLGQGKMQKDETDAIREELLSYLDLAHGYTKQTAGYLIITHGLSGSGKTSLTQSLLEKMGAIRIRSDVERKRLAGLQANDSSRAGPGKGIYSKDFSHRTYQHLYERASEIIDAGYPVIVDATFLEKGRREPFRELAAEKGVAFRILSFVATPDVLRQRIQQRHGDASDADLVVLESQLGQYQPLDPSETDCMISIDTESVSEVNPNDLS